MNLMVFFIGLAGVIFIIIVTFAWGGIQAAPWVPLWSDDVARMVRLSNLKSGELLYDLGAGDGRIISEAAKHPGVRAIGFEVALLPFVIGYCTLWIRGQYPRARLRYRNFYHQSLRDANVVCTFLTPSAMAKLKPLFETQLTAGCRVVSYAFPVPGWQPTRVDKPTPRLGTIYVYTMPAWA